MFANVRVLGVIDLGEAKVGDLDLIGEVDEEVLAVQVAVTNAKRVKVFHC